MDSVQSLQVRISLYALLSRLFTYPLDAEVLTKVARITLKDDTLETEDATSFAHSLRDLQQALANLKDASLLECLNVEMTRLMEGPGLPPAPPYASYYLNGRQLMGPAAQAARRVYLEWLTLPTQGSIPPDHIALELGFLAFLAERTLKQDEMQTAPLQASFSFLQDHVQPWLPRFCADMETNSREPFFTALARFTRHVIEADQIWLDNIVENPQEILL